MSVSSWIIWAIFLLAQNFSFTFVSRARNSGSLKRHMIAALLSNGIWFGSQLILLTDVINMIKGSSGIGMAFLAGLFYTVVTMAGSLWAHKICLKNEEGKDAVGANDKYVQITKETWDSLLANTSKGFAEIIDWISDVEGKVRKLDAEKPKRTNRKTAEGAAGKGPVRKRVARAGNRT
jgi:hypothetical protein